MPESNSVSSGKLNSPGVRGNTVDLRNSSPNPLLLKKEGGSDSPSFSKRGGRGVSSETATSKLKSTVLGLVPCRLCLMEPVPQLLTHFSHSVHLLHSRLQPAQPARHVFSDAVKVSTLRTTRISHKKRIIEC